LGHSAIWDLRGSNTFEFCCPYTACTQYLNALNGSFGNIFVYALDPLIAASTVSTTVEITVLVRGGSNFEFAMPCSAILPAFGTGSVIIGQSGGTPCVLPTTSRDADCAQSIGERVLSVKQLITKACPVRSSSQATLQTFLANSYYTFVPISYGATDLNAAYQPLCEYIARMFVYARGSTCYDVFKSAPSTSQYMAARFSTFFRGTLVANSPSLNSSIQLEGNQLHVRMPYNNTTPRDLVTTTPSTSTISNEPRSSCMQLNTGTAFIAYKRAGDDAQLGYLYGCPALALLVTGVQPIQALYEAVLQL